MNDDGIDRIISNDFESAQLLTEDELLAALSASNPALAEKIRRDLEATALPRKPRLVKD